MAQSSRAFRTPESLAAEEISRDAVAPFLESRGFRVVDDSRKKRGTAITQIVRAAAPDGTEIVARVRLCWRRDGSNPREKKYAAAQLLAHLVEDDWEKTLTSIVQRDSDAGVSHTLLLQYDAGEFVHAALIPRDALPDIWRKQRDISAELIASGRAGRSRKNKAMNGKSPTLWLQDDFSDDGKLVPQALWSWPGVQDVLAFAVVSSNTLVHDDTMDDCPVDVSQLGRDGGTLAPQVRSGYARDRMVREVVLARARGACERSGCGARRDFPGFLDVHHVLGVGTSDRVWNCVALCPNCHREAHYSPSSDLINEELAIVARTKTRDFIPTISGVVD